MDVETHQTSRPLNLNCVEGNKKSKRVVGSRDEESTMYFHPKTLEEC